MLNPEDLVVGGQAFTEYPEGLDRVRASFDEQSLLPSHDVRVTVFGNRVQEAGAGVVALSALFLFVSPATLVIAVATVAATWGYFGTLRWQVRNADTKQFASPDD
jgi:hypothetical protein